MLSLCGSIEAKTLVEEHIDSVVNSTRLIVAGDNDRSGRPDAETAQRIIEFYYDQFRHSQDPDAPMFLFMSKDSNILMGIGGTVRMRAWYDVRGDMPTSAFIPYQIPIVDDPANDKALGSTPAGTCLFFRVLGRAAHIGNYQLYIEANFNGYKGRDFHLKKAYGIIGDFTIGYASSTFCDPAAVPSSVDAGGPSNKMDHTTVLVRYMHTFKHGLTGAISVEAPDVAVDADNVKTENRRSYIPDFAAMVQYSWRPLQHIRLSGVLRSLPYRDLLTSHNYNTMGWGVQLSSVNNPCDAITTYITANYGAGYAGMGGDLLNGAYDLIGDPELEGRLYAPRSFGWNIGVQYNFRHNLFMTISGSQTRFLPSKQISPDEYKYGLLGSVNIFWNPLPRIQLGAEFDVGKRCNFSGAYRTANRFGLIGQVTF